MGLNDNIPKMLEGGRSWLRLAIVCATAVGLICWILTISSRVPAWARFAGSVALGAAFAAAVMTEQRSWARHVTLALVAAAFALWIGASAARDAVARPLIHTAIEGVIAVAAIERGRGAQLVVVGALLALALLAESGRFYDPATPMRLIWIVQLELLVIAAVIRQVRR